MANAIKYVVPLIIHVEVLVSDPDVVERVTGPGGDDWRDAFYGDVTTRDDVLLMLADNAYRNGVEHVGRLDGWGDLGPHAAVMRVLGDFTDSDLDLHPILARDP